MRYMPIDEYSLRHIFSSKEGEEILGMQYLGPVLGADGKTIETSPDCLIIDKRTKDRRILRAEFKFAPRSKDEFAYNGKFDIAIVWSLPASKSRLLQELLAQNGCFEILVLSENKYFYDLKPYRPNSEDFNNVEVLEKIKHIVKPHTLYAAYIAAKIFPKQFEMYKMVNMLADKFPEVKKMRPQGRANAVSSLLQIDPPLIKQALWKYYEWDNDVLDHEYAWKRIKYLIPDVPTQEEIERYL